MTGSESVALEITVVVAGREYVVPIDLVVARAILARSIVSHRAGQVVDLATETPEEIAHLLSALWMHELSTAKSGSPWNIRLADGANVAIRADAVSAVIGRVIPATKGMGFGSVQGRDP